MGTPTQPVLDIMRRTMLNLEFIEVHADPAGPYEVTQLINSFLGALAHPFEAMRTELMSLSLAETTTLGWPSITKEKPTDNELTCLGDLIRLMRNGLAHGNVEFLDGGDGQISSLRIWNIDPRTRTRTWGTVLSIDALRLLLCRFVELIEQRHKDFGWYTQEEA